jgi:N-acetylmuramic acid 6-phosphate etherase
VEALDLSFLIPFIVAEASIYQQQERVLYCTDKRYAITLLTDTTERAPTFSLTPFTNKHRFEDNPSWCYLSLTGSRSASQAWQQLLERSPRALEWPETRHLTGLKRFFGFDISECANGWLAKLEGQQHQFVIELNTDQITFQLGDQQGQLTVPDNELFQHLLLKLVINIHSTLVMGRLGRYQANLMTYVYPSNNKLIDRAIRYAGYLLNQQGIHYDYQTIGEALFDSLADIQPDQPAVLTLVNHLLTRQTPVNSRTD